MRFLILVTLLFWGTIVANFAQDYSEETDDYSTPEVVTEISEEGTSLTPAIDHKEFDSSYIENKDDLNSEYEKDSQYQLHSDFSKPTETYQAITSVTEVKQRKHDPYKPQAGFGVGIQHLGILTKVGLEKSLFKQLSAGLYYGRFLGHYYGTDKKGIIPGLSHYSLEFNIYMNSQNKVFRSGPVLKFGAHYNRLNNNLAAEQVEVKGQKVIGRGEHRWGALIGAAYFWQGPYVNLSVGSEYFALGKLKAFVPLTVSLGIAF